MSGLDIWHVATPVSNLAKSEAFYINSLGFVLVGRDEYPSKKQTFVAVRPGGFTIELFERLGKHAAEPALRPDHLAFECEDIDAFRAQLIASGAVEVPEIETFDNGVRYLGLNDPDGVYIEFFQGRKIYEASIRRT
jgi:catechol 2,3-dioxygenase-like lactoylglutathione lyase family enzyme